MIKKSLLIFLGSSILLNPVKADEGMWLPLLLKSLCEKDMQNKGMKISAEDIYSINQSSLKDAVVLFGGGCTGEVVSDKGLLFTNHHCGIGQVQAHSSVTNDYIKNGFWAKSQAEELPNPGLSVTFIVRIDDVTNEVKAIIEKGVGLSQKEFGAMLDDLEKKAIEGTHYEADIKVFDYGNAYYLFVTETFKDVRLVGAPPQTVGEFGGDTDNWMWPRHTGDFSVFRIYAGKDNKPAAYSAENVPFVPRKSLKICTDGVKEGDFAMVYGFPGRTQQYLPSVAVEFIMNESNPAKIKMRDNALEVINASMNANDKVRIQYTAKESRISNAWKKWKGEITGLKKTNALEKKKETEAEFTKTITQKEEHLKAYGSVLESFKTLFTNNRSMLLGYDYFNEFYLSSGPEIFKFAGNFENLVNNFEALEKDGKTKEVVERLKKSAEAFYKNFDPATDRKLFERLIPVYMSGCPKAFQPTSLEADLKKFNGDVKRWAEDIYGKSVFTDYEKLMMMLIKPGSAVSKLKKDKVYLFMTTFLRNYRNSIEASLKSHNASNEELMRKYVEGIAKVFTHKKLWYDANSTMRIGYGIVEGSEPRNGIVYDYYTTTEGILEKNMSGAAEYAIPDRLKELLNKEDFGKWKDSDGKLHTCFTSSSQTTGGNSGSPVLNAYGELIGLNFDRSWESTMSDIMYSPKLCRNIVCDIRYVLFIMDKYAGAGYLIDEMKLVSSADRAKK